MNIKLCLPENGKQYTLFANAEVVWTSREEKYYRYGFSFVNMDLTQRNVLNNFLGVWPETCVGSK